MKRFYATLNKAPKPKLKPRVAAKPAPKKPETSSNKEVTKVIDAYFKIAGVATAIAFFNSLNLNSYRKETKKEEGALFYPINFFYSALIGLCWPVMGVIFLFRAIDYGFDR